MSIAKKILFKFFILTIISVTCAQSEELKKIGTFKDWEAVLVFNDGGKLCFAHSKPVLQSPKKDREAKLRTVIAYKDDNRELSCDGSVKGEIAQSPKGSFGFGYDSVFYYPPLEKTFAELSEKEKNSISHRGRALRKFLLLFNNKK